MQPLTRRQSRVLTFIRNHIRRKGYAPSRIEIARSVGSKYPNTGTDFVKVLIRKGYLKKTDGLARTLQLTKGNS